MVFEETQNLRKFMWVLLPLPIVLIVLFTLWYNSSSNAEERTEIFEGLVILIAVETVVGLLFFFMKLKTTVDNTGIRVSYFPFIKEKHYTWEKIEKAWVRKYKPLAEYGGWGIRAKSLKGKNMAYNVWGNNGLQLQLKSGKKLLIGTQKTNELVSFLSQLKETYQISCIESEQLTYTQKV